MSRGLIVLKFGGSVLQSPDDVFIAVHEIYRWLREGNRVIAVVSAIGQQTDQLVQLAESFGDDVQDRTRSALIAIGEVQSAALLAMALDQCGISNRVMTAGQIGLRTTGSVLDALPCDLDCQVVRRALDANSVVIVPGFVGVDADGHTTLLGRGGSDLTAIFLANRLAASRCRLIKDVDGLFESDPNLPGPAPRKFVTLSWQAALELDESIVQHKSIRFAREHGQDVEVAAFNSCRPSLITDVQRDTLVDEPTDNRLLRVGLLGFGVVGQGIYQRLMRLSTRFRVSGIAVRNKERAIAHGGPATLVVDDPLQLVESADCDVVVEAMGGLGVACECIQTAIDNGKHVVTANKSVVARHGPTLARLAHRRGVSFQYSAAVGGGAPILEWIDHGQLGTDHIRSTIGVLNGTSNFILERMHCGESLETAVIQAQRLGLAESDPIRDLNGTDAAEKLVIVARALGLDLDIGDIRRQSIDPHSVRRMCREDRRIPKQIASLVVEPAGVSCDISIERVNPHHPFASVRGADNAVIFATTCGNQHVIAGRGAGRWATAESVVGDLLQIQRDGNVANRTPVLASLTGTT